jgi:hypothetical protein
MDSSRQLVQFQATIETGSTTDQVYVALPPGTSKFRVVGGRLTCMSGGGVSAETLTIYCNSVELGVFTLATTTVAGTSVSLTKNATYGNTINTVSNAAAGAILALPSATWTSTIVHVILEIDVSCVPLS